MFVCEQGSEELQLSIEHIKQIICILRDFIHSPERRVMADTISKLKLDLDFDSNSINQIQLVLFGFQDSVSTHTQAHNYTVIYKSRITSWDQKQILTCKVSFNWKTITSNKQKVIFYFKVWSIIKEKQVLIRNDPHTVFQ